MNFLKGSWLPKLFGTIAMIASGVAYVLPDYAGIATPIAMAATWMSHLVARQDDVPSENTGAKAVLDEKNAIPIGEKKGL